MQYGGSMPEPIVMELRAKAKQILMRILHQIMVPAIRMHVKEDWLERISTVVAQGSRIRPRKRGSPIHIMLVYKRMICWKRQHGISDRT